MTGESEGPYEAHKLPFIYCPDIDGVGSLLPQQQEKLNNVLQAAMRESVGLPTETIKSSPTMLELQPQVNEAKC